MSENIYNHPPIYGKRTQHRPPYDIPKQIKSAESASPPKKVKFSDKGEPLGEKITIYSVLNEAYYALGTVWLKSLMEKMDEKIKKIYIADVGVSEETKDKILKISDKIEFLKTTTHSVPQRIHDNDWKNAVSEKTRQLLKLCEKDNYPLVMMDADKCILESFDEAIYKDCDLQVCEVAEEDKPHNQDGYDIGYIGSWFVIHNDKGKEFLQKWIERSWTTRGAHIETPALCLTLASYGSHYEIKVNHESVVSAYRYSNDAKVLHFRSDGQQPVDLLRRVGNINNLPVSILEKVLNYIR